jgi:hypothetical protein
MLYMIIFLSYKFPSLITQSLVRRSGGKLILNVFEEWKA